MKTEILRRLMAAVFILRPSSFAAALAFFGGGVVAFVLLASCPVNSCSAQGTQADFDRMNGQSRVNRNKVFRIKVAPKWVHGETGLWYRTETAPGSFEFVVVEIEKGIRKPAFNPVQVAKQLAELSSKDVSATDLPFQTIALDEAFKKVFFQAFGKAFQVDRETSTVSEIKESQIPKQELARVADIEKSGPNEKSIHIKFHNQRQGPIRLIWIDREGRSRSYGQIAAGETHRQHTFVGHVWVAADNTGMPLAIVRAEKANQKFTVTTESKVEQPIRLRFQSRGTRTRFTRSSTTSPDRKYAVQISDHNVVLKNLADDQGDQITNDGTEQEYYTKTCFWSPDSKKVIVLREQPGESRIVTMVESSPGDQLQPRVQTIGYRKPGDRIPVRKPVLIDVVEKRVIPVDDQLFKTPWRLTDFRWTGDSSEFRFRYNQRGHQVMRRVGVNAESGKVRAIVEEKVDTFIDYNHKFKVHYLPKTDEIIWSSERDGWNHLYLYDAKTGTLKNQITKGKWLVRKIDRVDPNLRQVWFQAGGIIPNQDPYYIHFCRVDFSGENLVVMTAGDGTHQVTYSPTRKYLIDSYSKVDMPAVHEVRRVEDGSLVCKLESGDDSRLLETGWKRPQRFLATGRDGETNIFGVIYLPSHYDPRKKYPVIEYIYAGPHGSFVPKSYSSYRRTHALTELGFIVVQIDGMGTSNRSKAFHDVCWKNLGDSGFPDRIRWLKAAAQKYPAMDLSRVGIFGGSAGGQSALRALLAHGDFYKVAVADCGCHDNRMDKIWWNEQWMGWPIGPHYKEQSNVTQAHKLTGKLFLIVGELDRNVDPASTLQVVNALIKANKDFDFLLVPGAGHGVGSRPYGLRRTHDFFVRHLLKVEPRSQASTK